VVVDSHFNGHLLNKISSSAIPFRIVSKSFHLYLGETMVFTLPAKENSGNRFIVSPPRKSFSFSFIDMIIHYVLI